GVGRCDGNDVGNLRNVELGRHTRRNVLARSRGREQDVTVVAGDVEHLCSNVFGQPVLERSAVGQNDLADAGNLGSLIGHRLRPATCNQNVNIATDGSGRSYSAERRGLQLGIVVFSNNQIRHDHTTFASFLSLSTSVATSGTMMPALRAGGSETLSVFRRGATSTPRSSGVTVSSGFFLAFMMLGSVT